LFVILTKGLTSVLGRDITFTSVWQLELRKSGVEYKVQSYGLEPCLKTLGNFWG